MRFAMTVFFAFISVGLNALPNLNPVNNANIGGFARVTRLEFPMDENDSLRFFYLEFCTNPASEPGMFGAFWHMPVFSSKVESTKANELKWHAPDGETYHFCSHFTEKKGKEIISYTDNNSRWKALKKKGGFDIVSLIDGSCFMYRDGRLSEFMLSDKRRYQIAYRREGGVSSVKDRSGRTVFAFDYHKDLKHVKSVKTYNDTCSFEYYPRKSGDILGNDHFYGQALLLRKIESAADGNTQTFEYVRSRNRPRTILLKDLNELATSPLPVNKMSIVSNGESKGWIEWCAATGIIMADNSGEYMVGNDKHDSFFPNFKPGQGNAKFSAIKYVNPNAKYPQIFMLDYQNYYEIKGNPFNGEILRNSLIGACGPLKMEVRKVEKLEGSLNGGVWSLVKSKSYDHNGRLAREFDNAGNITEYAVKTLDNGDLLSQTLLNGRLSKSERFSGDRCIESSVFHENGDVDVYKYDYSDIGIRSAVEKYTNGKIVYTKHFDLNRNGRDVLSLRYADGTEYFFNYHPTGGRDIFIKYADGREILKLFNPEFGQFVTVFDIDKINDWKSTLTKGSL